VLVSANVFRKDVTNVMCAYVCLRFKEAGHSILCVSVSANVFRKDVTDDTCVYVSNCDLNKQVT
jgi:hypothetical protein